MPSPVVRAPPSSVEDAGLILVKGFKIPYTVGCSPPPFFLIEKTHLGGSSKFSNNQIPYLLLNLVSVFVEVIF